MVSIAVSWIGYHILLPITLIASFIFRYNVFSAVYLILLLVHPYVPSLTHATKGKCSSYTLAVLCVSMLFILAQFGFQIALLVSSPYGSLIGDQCTTKEKILRCIGLERLDQMAVSDVFRFLLPDILCFIIATVTFVFLKKTVEPEPEQFLEGQNHDEKYQNESSAVLSGTSTKSFVLLGVAVAAIISTIVNIVTMTLAFGIGFGNFCVMMLLILMTIGIISLPSTQSSAFKWLGAPTAFIIIMMASAGVVNLYVFSLVMIQIPVTIYISSLISTQSSGYKLNAAVLSVTMLTMSLAGISNPSVFSALYLLVFMILMTNWSLHGKMFGTGVANVRILVSFVAAVQLILMYFYQMEFFRDFLPPAEIAARLMGLTPFVNTDCKLYAYSLVLNIGFTWIEFINPLLIFIMYYMLSLGVRIFFTSDQHFGDVQQEETAQSYEVINAPSISHTIKIEIEETHSRTKPGFLQTISDWILSFKNQSCNVYALIAMMAWSVKFHSWFTLLLLVWCILSLVKNRSWRTLVCFPVIIVYAMLLICLQFLYSLNLTEEELPTVVVTGENKTMNLSSFGIKHYYNNNPCLFLGAQILYACVFWVVYHQFIYIRRHGLEIEQEKNSWLMMVKAPGKYWLCVVYGYLLAMIVEGRPSGIKIIYALCFILNGFLFEFSWEIWRRTLSLFLYTLGSYSILVVLLVHTFQFDEFPGYWKSATNFTDGQLADFGLIKYDKTDELLLQICIPTFFLLVVILQKHYFHDKFLERTEKRRNELNPDEPQDGTINYTDVLKNDGSFISSCYYFRGRAMEIFGELVRFIWKFLEFHMRKLLIITVLVSALQTATALYAVIFVLWVIFIPIKSLRLPLYIFTSAYFGILLLFSMFYQLDILSAPRDYNCTFLLENNTVWSEDFNAMEWLGFFKMTTENSYIYHAWGYITIIIVLALERIVMRRQDWHRYYRREPRSHPQLTSLFPSVNRIDVDSNFRTFCKYIMNYWFYTFGVEACYIMTAITIWSRADLIAVVYSVLLIIAMCLKTRKRFWRFYVYILKVILIGEYAIALGMPPMWCTDTTNEIRNCLIRWLFLLDYIIPPFSSSLIVDVFQLLFIVCQLLVFNFDSSGSARSNGGNNRYPTAKQLDEVTLVTNPKPNFMMKGSRNVLDQVKTVIFKYLFWVTCAIVLIAGTSNIFLFCTGYVIYFFYLVSFNESLLTGKPSQLLITWNIVLGYNITIIMVKILLQITCCVYIDSLEETDRIGRDTCATPNSYTNPGLTWDFVCFLFLIIQKRISQTHCFLHVSEDLKISIKLASRGAELFEEKLIQKVNSRKVARKSKVAEIRKDMVSLQKRHSDVDCGQSVPLTHTEAMRSGDLYMFKDQSTKYELESDEEKDVLNPLQMLNIAHTERFDKALEEREENKELLRKGDDNLPVQTETLLENSTQDHGEEQETKKRNVIVKGLKFVWVLFLSGVDTFILWLNTVDCDYRNVAQQLSEEKDELAQRNLAKCPRESSTEILIEPLVEERQSEELITEDKFAQSIVEFDKDQMRIFRLFRAIWYMIISHTEVVCYFFIILNLMRTASLFSLVLPILIFLWASLSIPRPTRRFWNFCIIYLEFIILVKFLFQLELFPWNSDAESNLQTNNPFWWPRIIGTEQKVIWSMLDLVQLLAIFFHRSILKVHGLWDKIDKTNKDCDVENVGTKTDDNPRNIKESSASGSDAQPTPRVNSHVHEGEDRTEDIDEKFSKLDRLKRAATLPYRFYRQILNQEFSAVTDVYNYMFLCDFINFIIIIFGYWVFGKHATEATNVVSSISSNKVPTGFLVMLLIQSVMMFIDRALYLRKNLFGKIIFQICLVIGIHVWMFFILPDTNERPFYMNNVAQTWYFFKAIYFLLSAYQIRCGYPTRVLASFLTNSYCIFNLCLYKVYRMIPFLFEVNALMNWMFFETTMGIGEWFNFQSIYAQVFELKCWRVYEKNNPSQRNTPTSKSFKYLIGGLLVFFSFVTIWFPLLFMNIVLTIGGLPNNPVQVSVQITLGTFEPIFQVVADLDAITVWDENKFKSFAKQHSGDASAAVFLSAYSAEQVVSVKINRESKTVWAISPPHRQDLINLLHYTNLNPVQIDFEWQLTRHHEINSVVTVMGSSILMLEPNNIARAQLYDLLATPENMSTPATIKELFPRYVYSGPNIISTPATKLYASDSSEKFVDTSLSIRCSPIDNLTSWWRVFEVGSNATKLQFELVVFSDKVSPASLGFIVVNLGIFGLYIYFVFMVGKTVRAVLVGSTGDIMFQELPRVDQVLQLCLDIDLVREERQYQLEEDLYAKLIFLYRSPQTMIQYTRPKQE